MGRVLQWTSIKVVEAEIFSLLPETMVHSGDIRSWMGRALEDLKTYPTLEEREDYIPIENHTGDIPCGAYILNQVAYMTTCNDNIYGDFMEILDSINGGRREDYMSTNCKTAHRYFHTEIMRGNCFKPLKLNVAHFSISDSCRECGFATDCEHSYSICPGGIIRTSFPQGILKISYMGYPKDECGDFIIPDEPEYIEAIKNFVLYKTYEKESIIKKDRFALAQRDYYRRQWNVKATHVKGSMMMPTLDELENIRRDQNRLYPISNRWGSFFGNMNTTERYISKGYFLDSVEKSSRR